MPRRTLQQLGWGSRRIQLVLRHDEWRRLEDEGARLGLDLADIISGDLGMFLRAQASLDRVSLTPDGEKAAAEIRNIRDNAKLGTGGAEW
jgi:hypothetical protein